MKKLCFIRNKEGNAAIEFALVAPVLFLLIMGIVEVSLIMFAAMVVENAATSAARLGITGDNYASRQDSGDIKNRADYIRSEIERLSGGLLDPAKVIFTPVAHTKIEDTGDKAKKGTPGLGGGGEGVTYEITYSWDLFTPMLGSFFDDGKYEVTSFVVVKNEDFE